MGEEINKKLSGRHKKWMMLINDLEGKTILDIGCSYGWFEDFAINSSCREIFAIEPDVKDFIEAKKAVPFARYLKGSALKIPFSDDFFDVVTLFDVIEHLPYNKEKEALIEIHRVLKPNGILYLSTPHKTLLSNLLDPAWYLGHRHYSENHISNLLEQDNFKIEWFKFGGGVWSQIYMILFYFYKFILHREMNLCKSWFNKKREEEYLDKKGFATIFIKAHK